MEIRDRLGHAAALIQEQLAEALGVHTVPLSSFPAESSRSTSSSVNPSTSTTLSREFGPATRRTRPRSTRSVVARSSSSARSLGRARPSGRAHFPRFSVTTDDPRPRRPGRHTEPDARRRAGLPAECRPLASGDPGQASRLVLRGAAGLRFRASVVAEQRDVRAPRRATARARSVRSPPCAREGFRLLELAIEPLERRLQEGAIARLYLGTIRLQPPDLGTDALTLRLGLEHDLSGLEAGLLEQHVVLAALTASGDPPQPSPPTSSCRAGAAPCP